MADKNIGLLPQASTLTDNSSFVCEDSGIAKRVTGKQFKDFAKEGALPAVRAAESAANRAEAALTKAPKIQNGTWWVFDASSQAYVDTGVKAQGERGIQGERGETGEPGKDGYTPVKGVDYFDGAPGEKGDPFLYEDFTPEQLDDLERGAKAAQAAAETAAASAATSAGQASVSEQNAAGSASAAKASQDAAKASENAAAGSASSSQESAASASASASEASASATAAAASETSAVEAKTAAETAKTEAGKSASAAKASEDAARESETASAESASAASASARVAKVSETAAKASESAAAGSASQAADSASSASVSAEEAANSANAASESESAVEAAKNAAQASETAAKASETAAKASETAAKASETASKQSETVAAGSASAAQQSASAAAGSATSAAQSAASIGNAEQVVTQKAEEASNSAANAAASAEAAARSAEHAEQVVGGDFATKTEAQGYANTAESNAKSYTDQQIAAIPTPDVSGQISTHNTNKEAHNDIRNLITGLTNRLNALADSDDTTLDQLSEIVAYIKNNKTLIDGITTSKVNVADIVNNLTTNVTNKPLSAAQGMALKALIDAITVPTKVSELENDSGYLTSYTETDPTVPAWAKAETKPTYTANEVGARPNTWTPSASDVGAIPASEKGTAGGVATLGDDGKVPSTQLPSMAYIPSSQKGAANGVATLGADALLVMAQRPKAGGLYRDDGNTTLEKSLTDISTTLAKKADLGEDGKVSESQLPEISASKTFTATIGTTWTENGETGVKSQAIHIEGILAKHTAKVDHAYTGDGTTDGYAAFVEAENQYLTYITNGYAETYNGGIVFHIFGDAPTVSIPIVVEVA